MKVLKGFILFVMLISIPFDAKSDVLMDSVMYQGNDRYSYDDIITRPYDLTFRLMDNSVEGEWRMAIFTNDNKWEERTNCYNNREKAFVITLQYQDWKSAKGFYDENLKRKIFQMRIRFLSDDGREDFKIIRLALIPSDPIVSDSSFEWSYNWEKDYCDIGLLSFTVESDGAQYFEVLETASHYFDSEDLFFELCQYRDSANEARVTLDMCDWGEYVTVVAFNKFGHSNLRIPISTTSLIDDNEVLERIEEIKRKAKIEDNFETKETKYEWVNNCLYFLSEMSSIEVWDLKGSLVTTGYNISRIDMDKMAPGVYIVKVLDGIYYYSFKIIKK